MGAASRLGVAGGGALRLVLLAWVLVLAKAEGAGIDVVGTAWEHASLNQVPDMAWTSDGQTPVRSLKILGPTYRGKETWVSAVYAAPANLPDDARVPGVILVHGGGGRPFPEWVTQWADRGYAALAIDVSGTASEVPGPKGYGGFDQIGEPNEDQWAYHAVANIIRAHSLLRSFPEVDEDNTAIMGVSWGGYLTLLAISLDHRFKAAVPVYGAGYRFLGEEESGLGRFDHMTPEERARWIRNWDPASVLPRATTPVLFVNGTEDRAFRLKSYHLTYSLVPADLRTIKLTVGLMHGQQTATAIREADRFIDSFCIGDVPGLAKVGTVAGSAGHFSAKIESAADPKSACAWYTCAPGPYHVGAGVDALRNTKFKSVSARVVGDTVETTAVPSDARLVFFEITDVLGYQTTSPLWWATDKPVSPATAATPVDAATFTQK